LIALLCLHAGLTHVHDHAAALRAVQVVVRTPSRSHTIAQLQQLMADIGYQQAVSRLSSVPGACNSMHALHMQCMLLLIATVHLVQMPPRAWHCCGLL
jgi:hypothetical protein